MLAIKEDNCVCLVFFFVQELNNRLDDVTQENSNLLSKVSSLEESISLADQERTILQDKMNALTEGKDEVEKETGVDDGEFRNRKTGLLRWERKVD